MTQATTTGAGEWRFDGLRALTEHGWPSDAWPAIYRQVLNADILVLCGPIWLGDNSSVMERVIERLGAMLKRAGGIPAHGNQRSEWEAGCRFDFENPEHR